MEREVTRGDLRRDVSLHVPGEVFFFLPLVPALPVCTPYSFAEGAINTPACFVVSGKGRKTRRDENAGMG